jgi:hypothetical protein
MGEFVWHICFLSVVYALFSVYCDPFYHFSRPNKDLLHAHNSLDACVCHNTF